jgi:hypothetical protein
MAISYRVDRIARICSPSLEHISTTGRNDISHVTLPTSAYGRTGILFSLVAGSASLNIHKVLILFSQGIVLGISAFHDVHLAFRDIQL